MALAAGVEPGYMPPGMARALSYAPYAARHHWTPDQVDNLPADVLPWLLDVERVIEQDADRRRERADGAGSHQGQGA